MTRRILVLTVLLALCGTNSARADLVIKVGTDIPQGGATTIDIFLTAATTMTLSEYSVELKIDAPYEPDSSLVFVEPAPAFETDPSYVFLANTMFGPLGIAGGFPPATSWFGSDLADIPVTLAAGDVYLLARLNLQHSSAPGYDPVGEEFTISMIDGPFTYFLDDTGIPPLGVPPGYVFSFSNGTAILQDPSVIPEPGSLLLFAVVALGAVPYLRRRWLARG